MSVSLSSPRIILLETLSYQNLPTHLPFYQDYQKFILKLKHYQLPIWSIRDAVNSEYPLLNQSSYNKYMRHDKEIAYDNHPGWHEHLFYADMIASLLMHREKNVGLRGRREPVLHQLQQQRHIPFLQHCYSRIQQGLVIIKSSPS